MSDILLFFKDNSVPITAFTAILGAVLGSGITFWFSRQNYKLAKEKLEKDNAITQAKIEADKKALRQQMITNNIASMRQEWINDLRSKASRFFVMVDIISSYRQAKYLNDDEFIDKFKDTFITSLMEKKELELYLTMALPFSRDSHEEKIPDIIRNHLTYIDKKISHEPTWSKEKSEEIDDIVTCCANHFKVLFKNEWNETKSLKEIDSEKYKIEKLTPPECTCSVKK
ncbi:TPA: hypothetical protein ACYSBI_001121 [Morganella morganii]